MSLDIAELDHACNVVRRQVEEEFRNLSIQFIVHKAGEREKTVVAKKNHILSRPAGRKVYDRLIMTKNIHGESTEFTGLIVNHYKFFGLLNKKHHTAVFFINSDEFLIDQNAKHQLYHLVWHSVACYKESMQDTESDNKKKGSYIIKAVEDKFQKSMHNLMADVFGAVMMEAQGHSGFIKDLNIKRATDALTPTKHYESDSYPFPVACEACQFVYDDLKDTIDPKTKIINQVMDLASEVSSTYGDSSIEEWRSFSVPAQEMAWMGYTPEEILGTAIYTSEDTHVRAIAYMIAETIDVEPETNIKNIFYNPFIEDAVNERNHTRDAEEHFQAVLADLEENGNVDVFKKEAKKQTMRLLMGVPTGWAAPALIKASQHYDNNPENDFSKIRQAYYECWQSLSWEFMKKLSDIIIDIKKSGQEATEEALIEKLDKKDAFKMVVDTLKIVKDVELPSAEKVAVQENSGRIMDFIYGSKPTSQ